MNYNMVASQAFDEIGSKSDPRQNFGKEAEVRHGKSCSSEPNSQYKLRKKKFLVHTLKRLLFEGKRRERC
jgi:hypothetical protein